MSNPIRIPRQEAPTQAQRVPEPQQSTPVASVPTSPQQQESDAAQQQPSPHCSVRSNLSDISQKELNIIENYFSTTQEPQPNPPVLLAREPGGNQQQEQQQAQDQNQEQEPPKDDESGIVVNVEVSRSEDTRLRNETPYLLGLYLVFWHWCTFLIPGITGAACNT